MLKGKVAIVTGASRGIGKAIAVRLAEEGASVAFTFASNRDKAADVMREINGAGGKAIAIQADVTVDEDVRRVFDVTEHELGKPEIIVANAGSFHSRPFVDALPDDFERGLGVSARGTFLTFAEAARRVPDGGRVIGFSTNLTRQGRPGIGLYTASKAVVEQFVKALAKELGPRGITVNAVAPGPTDTDMLSETGRRTAPQMTPLGRVAEPREIADVVVFLASDASRWITGQIVDVNGGMT